MMKRYVVGSYGAIILIVVLGTLFFGVSCSKPDPGYTANKYSANNFATKPAQVQPTESEESMKYTLVFYFIHLYNLRQPDHWATPRFDQVMSKWSASYEGNGIWSITACDTDYSYAGKWQLPESVCKRDFDANGVQNPYIDLIKPMDQDAYNINRFAKGIGAMPDYPFPVQPWQKPKELFVQKAQSYIANIPYDEAEEYLLIEAQQAIRNYRTPDWVVQYAGGGWEVIAEFDNTWVEVGMVSNTGEIFAQGHSR